MGEPRLIDANYIVEVAQHAYNEWNLAMATQDTNRGINKVLKMQELCKCVEAVANDALTIDPETLPIVKELREKLELVTEERDAAISDLKESAGCDHCANSCTNTETEYCLLCDNKECKCRGCLIGEHWEWRGPNKED